MIDLPSLESKALAATPGPWRVGTNDPEADAEAWESPCDVFTASGERVATYDTDDDAEHAAANSPDVTLALIRALRSTCQCDDREVSNPPTDWRSGVSIPHHTTCALFPLDPPDPERAPTAYAESQNALRALLAKEKP